MGNHADFREINMGLIAIVVVVVVLGWLVIPVFLSGSKRGAIIKKHYKSIGDEILIGARDSELVKSSGDGSETDFLVANSFSNEASRSALDEIKEAGLERAEERGKLWIMGEGPLLQEEQELLTNKVGVRRNEIGC